MSRSWARLGKIALPEFFNEFTVPGALSYLGYKVFGYDPKKDDNAKQIKQIIANAGAILDGGALGEFISTVGVKQAWKYLEAKDYIMIATSLTVGGLGTANNAAIASGAENSDADCGVASSGMGYIGFKLATALVREGVDNKIIEAEILRRQQGMLKAHIKTEDTPIVTGQSAAANNPSDISNKYPNVTNADGIKDTLLNYNTNSTDESIVSNNNSALSTSTANNTTSDSHSIDISNERGIDPETALRGMTNGK